MDPKTTNEALREILATLEAEREPMTYEEAAAIVAAATQGEE